MMTPPFSISARPTLISKASAPTRSAPSPLPFFAAMIRSSWHVAALGALGPIGCTVSPPGTPPEALISPNRPTFSDGTSLVPRDKVQVEMGWTFTRRDQGGTVASIQVLEANLVVNQTAAAHEQIADLLAQLRRERAIQIAVEARFLTVTANYLEELGIDLDIILNQGNAVIDTSGRGSIGVFGQSIGGSGGDSGVAGGIVSLGASGGSGNNSGQVSITNNAGSQITTKGQDAHGVFGQSVGGGGGNSVAINHLTVGRVPGGALVQTASGATMPATDVLSIVLREP